MRRVPTASLVLILWLAMGWLSRSRADAETQTISTHSLAYRIDRVDANQDRLELPNLPPQTPPPMREQFIKEVLFPLVKAQAAASHQPEVWEIGYFYLNGWGTPVDFLEAEKAFRRGPTSQRGHGFWRLANTFWNRQAQESMEESWRQALQARAEIFYRLALAADYRPATVQATIMARAQLLGWRGYRPNLPAAESLLTVIGQADPHDSGYLLTMAYMRCLQGRFSETRQLLAEVINSAIQTLDPAENPNSDRQQAARLLAALDGTNRSQLSSASALTQAVLRTTYVLKVDADDQVNLRLWSERTWAGPRTPEISRAQILETILPRLEGEAAAGKTPALWDIGYFYSGIWNLPENLTRAEEAFRRGLQHGQTHGMRCLASVYRSKSAAGPHRREFIEKAATLYHAAIGAGDRRSAQELLDLVQGPLWGKWDFPKDPARAQEWLDAVVSQLPQNTRTRYFQSVIYFQQRHWEKSYQLLTQVLPELHKATLGENPAWDLTMARNLWLQSARCSGHLHQIPYQERIEILHQNMAPYKTFSLIMPLALGAALAGLVIWTWRRKAAGPGIRLSLAWIVITPLASGMGFMISIPGLPSAINLWSGAWMAGLAALLALWLVGPATYLGSNPNSGPCSLRSLGYRAIMTASLLLMAHLAYAGYGRFDQALLGGRFSIQMSSTFFRGGNGWDITTTLLSMAVVLPFVEEVVFRGFLFSALEKRKGSTWALWISSILFALARGGTFAPPVIILALILGQLRRRSGKITQSYIFHALYQVVWLLV